MLQAFTRNYQDNSTDAGFQFTFYCDICQNGYRSRFIESDTYKKRSGLRGLAQGAGILGSLMGGRVNQLGSAAQRSGDVLSQRFDGQSPQWQQEHERAFEQCQSEAIPHFRRCPGCHRYVCSHCHNEDEGLCVDCAPRQEIYIARARAEAMKRNIDQAGQTATVWQGQIESKTTICPTCGKPAGSGHFCNSCGADMSLKICPSCGAKNAQAVRFCNNCGHNLSQPAAPLGACPACGFANAPGTRFCGGCGHKLSG